MIITEYLTKDLLLSKITQEEIFRYYIPSFKKVGTKFKSELREDPNASCIISPYNGALWYKDFGDTHKAVNCFGYVMWKYDTTFPEALTMIADDFNIQKSGVRANKKVKKYSPIDVIKSVETRYEFKVRNYSLKDKDYWGKYYLTPDILRFFDIYPLEWLRIINTKVTVLREPIMYMYILDTNVYKFLFPYSDYKWLSNARTCNYQGFNQLPWLGELLIITKSLKDVAVLYLLGYSSIAPQSESQLIDNEFVNSLRKRFTNIILFYDNDNPGIEGSKRNALVNNLPEIFIPKVYDVKDIAEFIEKFGIEATKNFLDAVINGYDNLPDF